MTNICSSCKHWELWEGVIGWCNLYKRSEIKSMFCDDFKLHPDYENIEEDIKKWLNQLKER